MKEEMKYPEKVVRKEQQEAGFKVSVLIPCKNPDIGYLKECFQSVRDQWYEPFEVLVLDNNSEIDNSKDIRELCKYYGFSYFREEKDGIGFARKRLVELSKGDYVSFLSVDDKWHETFLLKTVEKAKSNKDSVIYCSYLIMNSEGLVNKYFDAPIYADLLDFCVASLEQAQDNTMFVCFDCVLLPRKIFEYYTFDENLRQSEDLDFLLNTMIFIPYVGIEDRLVYYRFHPQSTTSLKHSNIAKVNKGILEGFYSRLERMKKGDDV